MSKRYITLKQFCKLFIDETPLTIITANGWFNSSAEHAAQWSGASTMVVDHCYRFNGNIHVVLK